MSETEPKISVILPSYNVREYIEQCIESVFNQTFKDIEVICVDAGSTDGTLEILKGYVDEYPNLNIFLSNKKSYGAQINQGLNNANGEYISIIETDDYVDPNMLESLYELTQFGYVDIVKSTFYHLYENGDERKLKVDEVKRNLPEGKLFRAVNQPVFFDGHPSIWSAIYRKSFLFNNNINFIEEEGGGWVDNPFLFETALKADTIIYTNRPYYYYRQSNENSSSNNLKDLSIPSRRISDMFDVLDKCGCEDTQIIESLYRRLFRYVEITLENNDNDLESLDYKTCKSLYEALNRVDEDYVHNQLSNKQKQYYYSLSSPLILSKFKQE